MRGGRVLSWNPYTTAATWLKVLRPVLINCYRRSNVLALSIQARAFSPTQSAAAQEGVPLSKPQGVGLWLGLLATLAIVSIKVLYWLYLYDLFYLHYLRPVYEFARIYL
jgi:energy-coupling factor transport system permease protein